MCNCFLLLGFQGIFHLFDFGFSRKKFEHTGALRIPLWGRMERSGLEGLGAKFLDTVKRVYKEPRFLFFAISSPDDVQGIWAVRRRGGSGCLELENFNGKTL
jgi:hypothetical protein